MARKVKDDQSRLHTLFVYGTLKQGFSNHYFLKDAEFVAPAKTVERYALFVDEFPHVYPKDPVCSIQGEVYHVDFSTLTRIDALEGHPNFYRRELVEVRLQSGEATKAWIYFHSKGAGQLIASGEFNPSRDLGTL